MQTDQELFAKGLATYQKVVNENFMAHKEVYGLLRQVLVTEAPDQFVFLDIACGTATGSAEALKGTNVGRCIGVDISRPSLDVAQEALRNLHCPVQVRCQDFVEAINTWYEPVHVVWIGQSPSPVPGKAGFYEARSSVASPQRALLDLGTDLL